MADRTAVIEGLVDALNDKDEGVRAAASKALGALGADAVEALRAAIAYDDGFDVYRFVGAARALGEIGPPAAAATGELLRGLKFYPADADHAELAALLRRTSAEALGKICGG